MPDQRRIEHQGDAAPLLAHSAIQERDGAA
jgi:hypothetical protein